MTPPPDGSDDNDEDGVAGAVEEVAGTDPDAVDTDGDGLTDEFEIDLGGEAHLGTSADTDGDGTRDPDEDFDGDGLTAADEQIGGSSPILADTDGDSVDDAAEIALGTSPANADSDQDDLGDGAEGPFGTDPTDSDTDDDGLTDGQEYALGTDPVTPDNAPTFTLDPAAPEGTSVSVEGPAEAVLAVTVTVPDDPAVAEVIGSLGTTIDVTAPEPVVGTIEFEFDPATVPAGARLAILHRAEATTVWELAPNQEIDLIEGVARTTTSSFSPFVLVNLDDFEEAFAEAMTVPRDGPGDDIRNADASLVIDSSGSMTSNDPNDERLAASEGFIDTLIPGDRVAVIDFDDSATLLQPLTTDFAAAKAAVNLIDSSGGTDIGAGIDLALDHFDAEARLDVIKVILLLTDGQGSYDPALTERASAAGVVIFTVGLGSGTDEALLEEIAISTGGQFFLIEDASDLPDLFELIGDDPGPLDTDGDGLSDQTEIDGIRNFSGVRIPTDPNVVDTDGDGLTDGEEAGEYIPTFFLDGDFVGDYYMLTSDPTMQDTDRDGLSDLEERDWGTFPRIPDTDGDGVTDGQEVLIGTDPLVAPQIVEPEEGEDFDVQCGWVSCSLYISNDLTVTLADIGSEIGLVDSLVSLVCLAGLSFPPFALICGIVATAIFAQIGIYTYFLEKAKDSGGCLKMTVPYAPVLVAIPTSSNDSYCRALSRR